MSKFDKLDKNKMKQRLDVLDKGTSDRFEAIPVEDISPNPYQPRKNFDERQLQELAHSIKEDGLLQPIIVQKNSDDRKYVLIAGERRLRAVKILGKTSIKAIILNSDTIDLKVLALIENTQRTNLSPIEEATSMKELMDIKGISKKELADLISKSYDHTVSLLSLTELPEKIQNDLRNNNVKISIQTLQSLSRVGGDNSILLYFQIKDKKLNKKESLSLISNFKKNKSITPLSSDNRMPTDNGTCKTNASHINTSSDNTVSIVPSCSVTEDDFSVRLNLELPISRKSEIEKVLDFLVDELGITQLPTWLCYWFYIIML